MAETVDFASSTKRFSLPYLYSGQSRKEFFVNEAFTILDFLLHSIVQGEESAPPTSATQGESWIVAENATGDWHGCDGRLACLSPGGWLYIEPREGMTVHDRSTGQCRIFFEGWQKTLMVQEPIGGLTVDTEARAAVNSLVAALQVLGILPRA